MMNVTTNNVTSEDVKKKVADLLGDEAFYRIMVDAYKEKFKVRTYVFEKLLKHMLSKIKEESTIYYLMDIVGEQRHNK